jgi:hypothetical protein
VLSLPSNPPLTISIDAKDVRLSTYTYNSDEGVPILRHTHEVTIWERDDGKNFTVKFIVDAPTADTWTKYVGYKVPMSKTGLKITFEFDNYLSHWNGTDIRLSNPSIFATFKTDIKVRRLRRCAATYKKLNAIPSSL